MGLMCFLGYFFLVFYGGIGMVALPLDLICSYGNRPIFVFIYSEILIRKVQHKQLKRKIN